MKTTLLFLAAGMGSRYGGLKQLDEFGPNGETLMEYSIYDGIKAGFEKIVFVIRRDFEQAFIETYIDKIKDKIEVDYVFQELTALPEGYRVPDNREKPWGTGHAILAAKNAIDGPFAVLNADDFYGREAYQIIHDFLANIDQYESTTYTIIGYPLPKTLSEHGHVSRGVCEIDADGNLIKVTERLKITREKDGIYYHENDKSFLLSEDTSVSMNLMGFDKTFFNYLDQYFTDFLDKSIHDPKSEYLLPAVVNTLAQNGKVKVKILKTDAQWFGVTYQEDRPIVIQKLKAMVDKGIYPSELWD
ncbi:MAG TPA: nucleotidyltransferase [Caldithrix sp.]|nr:NTP transferase domain-containing protein [Calditrichaceae bacterium]HEM49202.1 nucleotidyltransferase [Caldithrix sp.]